MQYKQLVCPKMLNIALFKQKSRKRYFHGFFVGVSLLYCFHRQIFFLKPFPHRLIIQF